ncbi:hypothetical protein sync_2704 [Synechococcus sp. CC9311]|nr:hypothetical protein sync_2704 [Synechococcus sp. CC9311]
MDVLVSVIAAVNPSHHRSPEMEVCKTFVDSMALGMGGQCHLSAEVQPSSDSKSRTCV